MAKGDPLTSPWVYDCEDYLERHLRITVPFDDTVGGSGNILDGTLVHRDVGCLYTTIVFANPTDTLLRKTLPPAPEGDTMFTWQQVRQNTGFRTINDLLAAGQVTAQ